MGGGSKEAAFTAEEVAVGGGTVGSKVSVGAGVAVGVAVAVGVKVDVGEEVGVLVGSWETRGVGVARSVSAVWMR